MGRVRMTLHFTVGPEDVPGLLPYSSEAMLVQSLLHSLKGLFDVAISLQQLAHKDAHLILEVLQGPPLLLD